MLSERGIGRNKQSKILRPDIMYQVGTPPLTPSVSYMGVAIEEVRGRDIDLGDGERVSNGHLVVEEEAGGTGI